MFATGFHNPLQPPNRNGRGFHDQRTVFYLMDRTSQRRIRLFISSYLNRTEKYKRNLREEQ